jgi:hypothetical protein
MLAKTWRNLLKLGENGMKRMVVVARLGSGRPPPPPPPPTTPLRMDGKPYRKVPCYAANA